MTANSQKVSFLLRRSGIDDQWRGHSASTLQCNENLIQLCKWAERERELNIFAFDRPIKLSFLAIFCQYFYTMSVTIWTVHNFPGIVDGMMALKSKLPAQRQCQNNLCKLLLCERTEWASLKKCAFLQSTNCNYSHYFVGSLIFCRYNTKWLSVNMYPQTSEKALLGGN